MDWMDTEKVNEFIMYQAKHGLDKSNLTFMRSTMVNHNKRLLATVELNKEMIKMIDDQLAQDD